MKSSTQQSNAGGALIGIACAITLAAAGSSGCFKETNIGTACELAGCDTSANCSRNPPVILHNEDAYITSSPGERVSTTPWQPLCMKRFTVRDPDGNCNVITDCQGIVNGSRVTGGVCAIPGPL